MLPKTDSIITEDFSHQNLASVVGVDGEFGAASERVLGVEDHLGAKDLGDSGLELNGDGFILKKRHKQIRMTPFRSLQTVLISQLTLGSAMVTSSTSSTCDRFDKIFFHKKSLQAGFRTQAFCASLKCVR